MRSARKRRVTVVRELCENLRDEDVAGDRLTIHNFKMLSSIERAAY